MKNPLSHDAISSEESRRRLRVLGLLSRPALNEAQQGLLRDITADPDWKPLPWLPSLGALDSLFQHHAIQAGVAPGLLRERRDGKGAESSPSLAGLGLLSIRRRALVRKTLAALRASGVGKMMLVKGEAVAPVYPSPALRLMSDVDLVIARRDLERAADAFRSSGFSNGPSFANENWLHPSGLMFDLHTPESPLPKMIFDRAEPHPSFRDVPGTCRPGLSDHLIVIAMHAAQSGGGRIWRDVCDANALLGLPGARAGAAKAVERAAKAGFGVHLAAFFRFVNRHAFPPFRLPEQPDKGWTPDEEGRCERYLTLYAELAVTPVSPAVLSLLQMTVFSHEPLAKRCIDWLRRRALRSRDASSPSGPRSHPWSPRDADLGQTPNSATFAGQWLKFKLLLCLVFSGCCRHYSEIFRLRRELRRNTPKLFSSLRGDRAAPFNT